MPVRLAVRVFLLALAVAACGPVQSAHAIRFIRLPYYRSGGGGGDGGGPDKGWMNVTRSGEIVEVIANVCAVALVLVIIAFVVIGVRKLFAGGGGRKKKSSYRRRSVPDYDREAAMPKARELR